MRRSLRNPLRKLVHEIVRGALAIVPRRIRFALYRWLIDCDPDPDPRLELKVADTREELEACFALLHDAYVASGFMKRDPSGLRVTIYHALPTTTTLCAKFDGEVVGTVSVIREGVFGFPLQSVFELAGVRAREGRLAEISALAVHPRFRKTGGAILFPLMKFVYEYCTDYFDTRHLVIAVNPNKVEMYESLLLFERLQASVVDNYDFANGAPAVGATLDLLQFPEQTGNVYRGRRRRKDLHHYFINTRLPHIRLPRRRYFTTNDPVMTPQLLDHFFNQRTRVFDTLNERQRELLHSIYLHWAYRAVLPPLLSGVGPTLTLRRHPRYSIKCPATLEIQVEGEPQVHDVVVIEMSLQGFQTQGKSALPVGARCRVVVQLGVGLHSVLEAVVMRHVPADAGRFHAFRVDHPDRAWRRCAVALQRGLTPRGMTRRLQATSTDVAGRSRELSLA